jgi:hypothetical protein
MRGIAMPEAKTPQLRRHAIQIVALLPENTVDAVAVLDHAKELLTQFVEPCGDENDEGRVVPFRR